MKDALLGAHGSHQSQTQSYYVQINELDRHSALDPEDPNFSREGDTFPHFKESHPALYMPRHKYTKYKMTRDVDNASGLGVIKEQAPKQYAIQKLLASNPKGVSNARELLNKSLEVESSSRRDQLQTYGSQQKLTLEGSTEVNED